MNDLDQFPSLRALGEQLEDVAERDAAQSHRVKRPRLATVAVRLAVGVGIALALASVTYTVPATRAAVGDLYDSTFARWFSGEATSAPGQPAASGQQLPDWLEPQQARNGTGETRVLAEANGERLVALLQGDTITLGVAEFSQTTAIAELRRELAGQKIRLLAPGRFVDNGRHDRRPIFGLVIGSAKRVQLNYTDGTPPDAEDGVDGAFGFVIQANRRPASLTAFDAAGQLVARKDLITDSSKATSPTDVVGDFRYCPGAAGCAAWTDSR